MRWIRIFENTEKMEEMLALLAPRKVVVHGREFCFVRTPEGVFAVEEYCPHRRESLSRGHVNVRGDLVCPLHHYTFRLRTGEEVEGRCRDLQRYPVEVRPEGVFLGVPIE
jgi:nitrite reductase/ring-hydroxylating ferredoxin subunit